MKIKAIGSFAFGCIGLIGFSQNIDNVKLDTYFEKLQAKNRFMGSIAVCRDGKRLYAKSIGFTDVDKGVKTDENSKYRIGSLSKAFTAVLVLKAVEAHNIRLDETIETYFPTLKNANLITIGQLLYHRSGIHNFTSDPSYLTWNTQPKSKADLLGIIAAGGSDFQPDTKADYSNSNYVLLTFILEKTYKKAYCDVLEEQIIRPLGLKNTYYGGKINLKNNEANSYTWCRIWKKATETDLSIPLGAGGIVSNATDITTFSDALFTGKILSEAPLAQMKLIQDSYGMGLFQISILDKMGLGHTGGIDGFSSLFVYFPDAAISFALTSNGGKFKSNKIARVVLGVVYDAL